MDLSAERAERYLHGSSAENAESAEALHNSSAEGTEFVPSAVVVLSRKGSSSKPQTSSLSLQRRSAEVEQQPPLEVRGAEVVQYLCALPWRERREGFHFHQHRLVANEVDSIEARQRDAIVRNREVHLSLERVRGE